ncbi:venom carboxylesterase-6-like [Anoplophora glabripennis]|uniref:venom carboxylesterase-6-like n=1 Tax=Anoplophora glabripennis TaxID=217634 RepID=UPI0008748996|nr:venom carboxylesterase-6-like [Anoplophora glabripennis]
MQYIQLITVLPYILCCWYCCALQFVPSRLQNSTLQVRLPQGTVQGKLKETLNRRLQYLSFEGIPYAEPPIGKLRFKPPVPARNWDGVLNTSRTFTSCVQVIPSVLNDLIESEDCLYINVFTTVKDLHACNVQVLPVMVWIYGGAFLLGSANSTYFGPDLLLEEGVVVAHFSYRLASFGFLNTEDLVSPGNYGLKDQHLALRWVKDNIKHFGGDPDKITIFGESAGSASVQYQLLYPRNEGLFQGAISESGSALCIWAFQRKPRKIAFDLGVAAGIITSNSTELVEYLQSLSVEKLKSATMKTAIKHSLGIIYGIPFAPTIEPEHPEAFLTDKPHHLLEEGKFVKVPYIIGFNSAETFLIQPAFSLTTPLLRYYDINPGILIPSGMNAGRYTNEAGKLIKEFYLSDRPRAENYLEYVNDGYFYRSIIESARLFSLSAPTFMYCFSYEGILGRKTLGYSRIDEYKGVVHTEEMAYIWSRSYLPEPNPTDKLVRDRMVKMWANFAKTKSPTPHQDFLLENISWPTVSSNMTYLDINKEMAIKQHYRNESMMFWKGLYEKYGRPPYDTY